MVTDGNKWIYKNKGVGMMSAAASLGLILLWDVEGGLSEIDKFLYASEDHIKVNLGWYCVCTCVERVLWYTHLLISCLNISFPFLEKNG